MAFLLRSGIAAASITLAFGSSLNALQPLAPVAADHAAEMAAGLVLFKGGVRELLVDNCLSCHGGDATEAGFSLSDRDALLKGGESGPAVIPRNSAESRLVRLIAHAEEPAMPQEASRLSDEDIASSDPEPLRPR